MAKALQCPACSYKHVIDVLPGTPTFQCFRCGQLLKVPAEFRTPALVPDAPAQPAPAPTPPPFAPSPSEPFGSNDATLVDRHLNAGTMLLPPTAVPGASESPAAGRPTPAATSSLFKKAATLPVRILAWILAVGVGGVVSFQVARKIGYLTGENLRDLLFGQGQGRYLKLVTLVPIWALLSASLAHFIIEGTRALMHRRVSAGASASPRTGRHAGADH